jgi:hypothetical protein
MVYFYLSTTTVCCKGSGFGCNGSVKRRNGNMAGLFLLSWLNFLYPFVVVVFVSLNHGPCLEMAVLGDFFVVLSLRLLLFRALIRLLDPDRMNVWFCLVGSLHPIWMGTIILGCILIGFIENS